MLGVGWLGSSTAFVKRSRQLRARPPMGSPERRRSGSRLLCRVLWFGTGVRSDVSSCSYEKPHQLILQQTNLGNDGTPINRSQPSWMDPRHCASGEAEVIQFLLRPDSWGRSMMHHQGTGSSQWVCHTAGRASHWPCCSASGCIRQAGCKDRALRLALQAQWPLSSSL